MKLNDIFDQQDDQAQFLSNTKHAVEKISITEHMYNESLRQRWETSDVHQRSKCGMIDAILNDNINILK